MQNSLSVSPFEICKIASWPFIYWERNSTPLIHYIWKISEPSPALTVKWYPCSTHLRLIEYLVINHSHWAKGQIQINTKYGIKWYQNHIMLWTIHKCNNLFFIKSTSSFCLHRCIWRVKNNIFFFQLMDLVHHFSISELTKTKKTPSTLSSSELRSTSY